MPTSPGVDDIRCRRQPSALAKPVSSRTNLFVREALGPSHMPARYGVVEASLREVFPSLSWPQTVSSASTQTEVAVSTATQTEELKEVEVTSGRQAEDHSRLRATVELLAELEATLSSGRAVCVGV
jgi:hypothetical protein